MGTQLNYANHKIVNILNEHGNLMHKLLFILVLAFMSTVARADWSEIGKTNDGTLYNDTSTIQRNADDIVKVWILHDLTKSKETEGRSYLSEKRLIDYDCKTEQVRSLARFFFSGNMAGGDMIYSSEVHSFWHLVEPASADYSNLKLSCNLYYNFKSWGSRVIHLD